VTAKVKAVSKVEGDASVCVVRGTKRYLFDLNANLDYEVNLGCCLPCSMRMSPLPIPHGERESVECRSARKRGIILREAERERERERPCEQNNI
jgi:hypothetical protein